MVNAQLSELTVRALLVRTVAGIDSLEERMATVEEALATANAKLDQVATDIATEIAQVAANLTATQDVTAAVAGLTTISDRLTSMSTSLQADDPAAAPPGP